MRGVVIGFSVAAATIEVSVASERHPRSTTSGLISKAVVLLEVSDPVAGWCACRSLSAEPLGRRPSPQRDEESRMDRSLDEIEPCDDS